MKKIVAFLLLVACVLAVSACGKDENVQSSSEKEISSEISSIASSADTSSALTSSENIVDEVNLKAKEAIASVVTSNMTEIEKLKITYEWLFWHFKYRAVAVDLSNGFTDELIYDLASYYFKYHKGSCEHYAAAQKVLFDNLGYESILVEGERLASSGEWGAHVWTIVKYEGNWYHVDGLFSGNHTPSLHTVFFVPDTAIEKTHKWEKANYPACTSPELLK